MTRTIDRRGRRVERRRRRRTRRARGARRRRSSTRRRPLRTRRPRRRPRDSSRRRTIEPRVWGDPRRAPVCLRSFGYARLACSSYSRDEKSLASRNVAEKAACTFGNGRSRGSESAFRVHVSRRGAYTRSTGGAGVATGSTTTLRRWRPIPRRRNTAPSSRRPTAPSVADVWAARRKRWFARRRISRGSSR